MADEQERKVNQIIAAFLEAEEAGEAPARDDLLRQHPDLAAELQSFFDGRKQFQRMAEHVAAPAELDKPAGELHNAPTQAPGATAATQGPGETIRYFGDYELIEEIARGGMGVVYRARQVSVNRPVAIKMILAGNLAGKQDVRRFFTEAEAAANLDHPNIVPIYEVGEHEGQHFFSMKLIEGTSLADPRLSGSEGQTIRSLTVAAQKEAATLIATVARAVHHAHQRGILHRDLKPGNVLIDKEGQPHVTDFGLAKKIKGDVGLTQSGAILGTPSYMAPEQARGEKGLSTAVDVYSLGAILYQLLTGKPPFQAETPLDIVLRVIERDAAPPRSLNASVSRDLETICLKCLNKDSARRYGSAQDLAEDLEGWLNGEPIVARPVGRVERTIKWIKRRPAAAALLGVSFSAVIAFCVLGIALLVNAQRLVEEAGKRATIERDRADLLKKQVAAARSHVYSSEIALAEQALHRGDTHALQTYLDNQRPKASENPSDQGGWTQGSMYRGKQVWRRHKQ